MFVFNLKVSGNKILKIFFVIILIIAIVILGLSIYRIFNDTSFRTEDSIETPEVTKIATGNYTNVLKAVHDNIENYLGMNINFSGYVYRVYDFSEDEFVLARDMVIDSNYQTLIVGFLCTYDNAKDFKDGTWVNITGTITKGDYHGSIPVIKVKEITEIETPSDEYVYPPDDFYIPTSGLL